MGVNPEETKAEKPVPAGWYEVRVKSIVCKKSSSGKGCNYEFYTNVVNNTADANDKFVMVRANNGFNQAKVANDITHGCGFVLEADGSFPGDWDLKDGITADASGVYHTKDGKEIDALTAFDGAQYRGPLLGKNMHVELAVGNWDGQDRNEVKQIRCKVDGCSQKFPEIRHLTDIRGKKK